MLVEMITTSASPSGILHAGKVYDLPRKRAEQLLQPGPHGRTYARKVAGKPEAVSQVSRPAIPEPQEDLDG